MPMRNLEKIKKIHQLRDEIKDTSIRVGRKALLELPQDPEDFVVLRGSVESLIELVSDGD